VKPVGERFLGEIRAIDNPSRADEQAPDGWVVCDGRLLAVADHPALYAALGSDFGGDGDRSFALPTLTEKGVTPTRYMMYLDTGPGVPEVDREAR